MSATAVPTAPTGRVEIDPAEIADRVARCGIPFNRYGFDPYGVSREHLVTIFTRLAWLYRNYFHVRAWGLEHIPDRGRAMLIGNHSGGIPLDGTLLLASVMLDKEPPRLAQGMVEKYIGRMPFASWWASRAGQLTGLPEHAVRLLEDERLLVVFPEGARGTAKLYRERHSLVRFGTGFLRLALQTGTPVVPFAFLGGGEAFPTVRNLYAPARLLGAPYIPIPRWGLPHVRKVPCQLYLGGPMRFEGDGSEREDVIDAWVGEVKERVAGLIRLGAERRERGDLDGAPALPPATTSSHP